MVTEFENSLLKLLIDKTKTYTKNEFTIDDIFEKGWKRIPVSTRKNIKKKFATKVSKKEIENIEFLRKDGANKQWYKKLN